VGGQRVAAVAQEPHPELRDRVDIPATRLAESAVLDDEVARVRPDATVVLGRDHDHSIGFDATLLLRREDTGRAAGRTAATRGLLGHRINSFEGTSNATNLRLYMQEYHSI